MKEKVVLYETDWRVAIWIEEWEKWVILDNDPLEITFSICKEILCKEICGKPKQAARVAYDFFNCVLGINTTNYDVIEAAKILVEIYEWLNERFVSEKYMPPTSLKRNVILKVLFKKKMHQRFGLPCLNESSYTLSAVGVDDDGTFTDVKIAVNFAEKGYEVIVDVILCDHEEIVCKKVRTLNFHVETEEELPTLVQKILSAVDSSQYHGTFGDSEIDIFQIKFDIETFNKEVSK